MALSSYNSPCLYMISRSGFCWKWHAELQGFHFHLIVGKRKILERENALKENSNYNWRPSLLGGIFKRTAIYRNSGIIPHPATLINICKNLKNPPNSTQLLLKFGSLPFFFFYSSFFGIVCQNCPNLTCLMPSFFCSLYISVVFTPNKNSAFSQ